MKTIGESTVSEMMPYLKSIGDRYGLRLNRAKEFKMVRLILANRYLKED
jgi:hypothetical protein